MAERPNLSRSLRRAANRKAIPRKSPADDSQLARAARAGLLTEGNTEPGTRGRQAVRRAEYQSGQANRRAGVSARAQAGHHPRAGTAPLYGETSTGSARLQIEGLTAGEVRRAGKYMHATRQLIDDLAARPEDADSIKRAFARRFARWRPIGGYDVVSEPAAVIALAERGRAEEAEPIFDSGRLPGRTRR